jgi:Site-specific recombinase XerD
MSFTVTFPTEGGFLGRECKGKECGRYFKVHENSLRDPMYCPYCGKRFSKDDLFTGDQIKHAQEQGVELAKEYMYGEIDKMFAKMRETEIRTLKWRQIDFEGRSIVVGKSKTAAGTGRHIPMNDRLTLALRTWANRFPDRLSDHYVFAAEQYGTPGDEKPGTHEEDPTQPIGSWKTAWKNARKTASVACRFHDLRHSAVTRLLEAGVSFPIVASLLGWSPSTTTKMAKRYGHIGNEAHREAVAALHPSTNSSRRGTKEGTVVAPSSDAEAVSA